MKHFVKICALSAMAFLAGCATPQKEAIQTGTTATCEVCRYNRDLACVCVKLKDSTPRADYEGQTYYFCSEDCRKAFLNKPNKYLSSHLSTESRH